MRQTKMRTVRGVKIEADDIVVALIDRLMKTEKHLESLQKQVEQNFEMLAEQQPKLCEDGNVELLAMRTVGDSAEQVAVKVIAPTSLLENRDEKTQPQ